MHALYNFIAIIIAAILTYTGLPIMPVILLIIVMIVDLISGMYRSARHGEQLSSHRFKSGFLIKGMILIIPAIVAFGVQAGMSMFSEVGDLRYVVRFMVMAIIVGEIVSIIGNIASAKSLKPKVEWDYLSFINNYLIKLLSFFDKRK